MLSDLPLDILVRIICFIPNPRKLLQASKHLRKTGKEHRTRGLWVLHQTKNFRSWLSIAAQNHILDKQLIITMVGILDDAPSQTHNQAKLIEWIISSSQTRFPSVTEKLKHAILSKNEKMLMEFIPFFCTSNGEKMKAASIELCPRVGFRKGARILKCI